MTTPEDSCRACLANAEVLASTVELHDARMAVKVAELDLAQAELEEERRRIWIIMVWADGIQEAAINVGRRSNELTALLDQQVAALQTDLDAAQARIRELEAQAGGGAT